MRKEIRIPTLLGVLALVVGVAVGVFLVSSKQLLFLKASAGEEPLYVTLTNVTDTSFTVSWTTNVKTAGTIVYGQDENSLSQRVADDRDQESGKISPFSTHHVTVGKFRPLAPLTDYAFVIQSGGTLYDSGGKVYHIKTGPTIRSQASGADSASGRVVHADGTVAEGAIVYLVLPGAYAQSTLVTSSGNWVIPLGVARSTDLSAVATYDRQAAVAEIYVQGTENQETANASAVLTNARPTPLITLGQKYDWRLPITPDTTGQATETPSPQGATPVPTSQPRSGFSLDTLATPSASTREVVIISPGNGESVNTQKPVIIGQGPKGTSLSVVVESSNKMSGAVVIGSDGAWEWNVPGNLAPGQHTVTVTYTDPLGQLKKIVKNFTVLAAESDLPAFVATPSASTKPSPTPIASPSPTAIPRVTLPSTESGIPSSGETTPTILLGLFGLLAIIAGVFSSPFSRRALR